MIKEKLDADRYVEQAERTMKEINENKRDRISTSKIRNILSMLSALYNQTIHGDRKEVLDRGTRADLQYCKMRCAYEAGRDRNVKNFMEKTHMMEYIDNIKTREEFILYYHYIEALVAYHRYYGGEE